MLFLLRRICFLNTYFFKYPSTALDFKLPSNIIPWENSCHGSISLHHLKEITERARTEKNKSFQVTTYLGKQTPLNDVWKLNKFNFSLELEGIHFACEAQPSET